MMKTLSTLVATAALLTTIGCGKPEPQFPELVPYRDYEYKFQEGQVTREFEGDSNYTVLVLPEDVNSYGCRANLFLKLESLLEDIKFVAREDRAGPTEHSSPEFGGKRFLTFDQEDNPEVHTYSEIIDIPFEERKRKVYDWISNRQYPSTLSDNPDRRNKLDANPMLADVLFESKNQKKVITFGVDYSYREQIEAGEDKGLAAFIAEREKTHPDEDNNELTFQKNWIAINVIDYYASRIEKGNIVPFITGYNRSQKFIERLETAGISFQVFEFDSCVQWYKDKGEHKESKL